jgi:ribosome-associated protein
VHRSQQRNRAECLLRLRELLIGALAEPKKRRKTRPTRGSRERRLSAKRARGEIKRGRGRTPDGHD